MVKAMTKEEKEWQAENDAYTLINAETIKSDKSRYRAALDKVKKVVKEKEKEANAAKKVVKKKKVVKRKKTTTKRTVKRKKK